MRNLSVADRLPVEHEVDKSNRPLRRDQSKELATGNRGDADSRRRRPARRAAAEPPRLGARVADRSSSSSSSPSRRSPNYRFATSTTTWLVISVLCVLLLLHSSAHLGQPGPQRELGSGRQVTDCSTLTNDRVVDDAHLFSFFFSFVFCLLSAVCAGTTWRWCWTASFPKWVILRLSSQLGGGRGYETIDARPLSQWKSTRSHYKKKQKKNKKQMTVLFNL